MTHTAVQYSPIKLWTISGSVGPTSQTANEIPPAGMFHITLEFNIVMINATIGNKRIIKTYLDSSWNLQMINTLKTIHTIL